MTSFSERHQDAGLAVPDRCGDERMDIEIGAPAKGTGG